MIDIIQHLKDFQTLYAACIGAIALVMTFVITVLMTFKFHKSDKLAEARLNVYLDFIESYTEFIVYILLRRTKITHDDKFLIIDNMKNLSVSYKKLMLLSESSTVQEIDKFHDHVTQLFHLVLTKLLDTENNANILESSLKAVEIDFFKARLILRHELSVKTDLSLEQKILDKIKLQP